MITEIHHVPGRLRARIGGLKGNSRKAAELEEHFNRLPGVLDVEARTATGSLIIYYAPEMTHQDNLLSALNKLGHAKTISMPSVGYRQDGLVERLAEAVAPMLVEAAIGHLVGGPAASILLALSKRSA